MEKELLKKLQYDIPGLYMVVLGGSQTEENGRYKDKSSDWDLIALTHDQSQGPVSWNNYNNGEADVIIRNPGTLAYEIGSARDTKRGPVLRMLAKGNVLFDPQNLAPAYQVAFNTIYNQGPLTSSFELFEKKDLAMYRRSCDVDDYITHSKALTPEAHAAVYKLAHDKAQLVINKQKQWRASGKMLGRFLLETDAEQHRAIMNVFKGNPITVLGLAEMNKIKLTSLDQDYQIQKGAISPNNLDYIAWQTREQPQEAQHYLTSDNAAIVTVASENIRYQWTKNLDNIKPERFNNPTGEYHFALAKAVRDLSAHENVPTRLDPSQRALFGNLPDAANGQPAEFKQQIAEMLLPIGGLWANEELFVRQSPKSHSLPGYDAETLPQAILQKLGL